MSIAGLWAVKAARGDAPVDFRRKKPELAAP